MHTSGITRGRQLRFVAALAKTGNVESAALEARLDRAKLEEARRIDQTFSGEWEAAEKAATRTLEHEAWRRAVDGVPEPLIVEGKVVRDDHGRPVSIKRYSDTLLIELLRASRPKQRMFWKDAFHSRRTKRLASIFLITLLVLIIGNLAVQWLRSHMLIWAFQ